MKFRKFKKGNKRDQYYYDWAIHTYNQTVDDSFFYEVFASPSGDDPPEMSQSGYLGECDAIVLCDRRGKILKLYRQDDEKPSELQSLSSVIDDGWFVYVGGYRYNPECVM